MWRLFSLAGLLIAVVANAQDVSPEENVVAVIEAEQQPLAKTVLPTCDEPRLLEQVRNFLTEYNKKHPVDSVYAKRQRGLQMKTISVYEEYPVEGFTSKQNRRVADKLLMTKINSGLQDSEIRLCRTKSGNTRFEPVYLMMYATQDGVKVYILNFLENQTEDLMVVLS